jgi:hypothetical protein
MSNNRSPSEHLIQQLAAGKLFRLVSLSQFCVHVCVYIASFVKLIIIEAGGYYDVSILAFIGITLGSMPLLTIALWLIQHSLKISRPQRVLGYCFHLSVCLWAVWIVKVSYFS